MSKETQIIDHLEGLDNDEKAIVGTTGQVQLIKTEKDGSTIINQINEFYDTVTAATTEANAWKG